MPVNGKDSAMKTYPKHFKHNYLLGILNGVLYNTGLAFINRTTIIPAFLSQLTQSSFLIGIASLSESLGWYLPQLFVAKFIVHKPRKLPVYNIASAFRIAGLIGLTVLTFLLGSYYPSALVYGFLFMLAVFALTGGISGPSFMDIVAKSVPIEKRGSFWAWRITISSAGSAVLGWIVINKILGSYQFPVNFGILFAVGTTLMSIGMLVFSAVKEPIEPTVERERTLRDHYETTKAVILKDNRFKKYFLFRTLAGFWMMGVPFYVIFARRVLQFQEEQLGTFITYEAIGYIVSNLFWATLSNRVGNRVVLRWVSVLMLIAPALVLLYTQFQLDLHLYYLVFFSIGATDSGLGIGGMNYIMEISPEHDRPTYIGLLNTFLAITLLSAGLGGIIIDAFSFTVLYAIVFLVGVLVLFVGIKLDEPRTMEL
jgi:MFS family permease